MYIPQHATVEQRARIYSEWIGEDVPLPVRIDAEDAPRLAAEHPEPGDGVAARLEGRQQVISLSRVLYGPRITVDTENNATVYVRGPLDRFWGFNPQKMGEVLDRIEPRSITLDIATPGGLIEQALQTFADFRHRAAAGVPVSARASGTVASAGVAMFAAADTRSASVGSAFMAHAPYVALYAAINRARLPGLQSELHRALEVSEGRMAATYKAAGISDETIAAWHDGSDHWFSPEEAHTAGLLTSAPATPNDAPTPASEAEAPTNAPSAKDGATLPGPAYAAADRLLDVVYRPAAGKEINHHREEA